MRIMPLKTKTGSSPLGWRDGINAVIFTDLFMYFTDYKSVFFTELGIIGTSTDYKFGAFLRIYENIIEDRNWIAIIVLNKCIPYEY